MKLSSKMATTKLANADNCKMFFPFNEGSGADFVDVITGATINDDAAAFTTPHEIGMSSDSSLTPADFTGVEDGWITMQSGSKFIFVTGFSVYTIYAFTKIAFGLSATARLLFTAGFYTVADDTPTELSFSGLPAAATGQNVFSLVAVDMEAGTAYVHSAINNASASRTQTVTTGVPTGPVTIPAEASMGNTGKPPLYGIGLWELDSLPSEAELNAALDFIGKNWSKGVKILPPQFA